MLRDDSTELPYVNFHENPTNSDQIMDIAETKRNSKDFTYPSKKQVAKNLKKMYLIKQIPIQNSFKILNKEELMNTDEDPIQKTSSDYPQ
ncbi:hypothetical protein CDAR_270091 [Caerostris darwini]|uniref:Uncharacterized protein n=1 Tax=Caerostris darwini TaxID=1538125 RepID=A0AAV4RNR4_9ARAC|nr:hypothetical protein CDAR_270091 [Caerostris darwini]